MTNVTVTLINMLAIIVKKELPKKIKYSREKQPPTPTLSRKHVENTSTHRMFSFAIPASQVYYESNENAMARQF